MSSTSYAEVYAKEPAIARLLLVRHWQETGSKRRTANYFSTSRGVVRKAVRRYILDGEAGLANRSRRPHRMPTRTSKRIEKVVENERKRTHFGAVNLQPLLRMRGIELSVSTTGNILRRLGLSKAHKKRSATGKPVCYYNLAELYPFCEFQMDLKEILDLKALPKDVYEHLSADEFPRYQWTFICVYTRLCFTTYSYEKTFANGLAFMLLVTLWLRAFGIQTRFHFQTDWGEEFGGTSERKLKWLQEKVLGPLGVSQRHIPKGQSQYNAFVERRHRMDDEYFYIPCGTRIKGVDEWFDWGLRWTMYYNTRRPHHGREMNGMTPLEKLHSVYSYIHPAIAYFPPVMMDNISTHKLWKGGNYVLDKYLQSNQFYWECTRPQCLSVALDNTARVVIVIVW